MGKYIRGGVLRDFNFASLDLHPAEGETATINEDFQDTIGCLLNGWTCDATYFVTINVPVEFRHDGRSR